MQTRVANTLHGPMVFLDADRLLIFRERANYYYSFRLFRCLTVWIGVYLISRNDSHVSRKSLFTSTKIIWDRPRIQKHSGARSDESSYAKRYSQLQAQMYPCLYSIIIYRRVSMYSKTPCYHDDGSSQSFVYFAWAYLHHFNINNLLLTTEQLLTTVCDHLRDVPNIGPINTLSIQRGEREGRTMQLTQCAAIKSRRISNANAGNWHSSKPLLWGDPYLPHCHVATPQLPLKSVGAYSSIEGLRAQRRYANKVLWHWDL